MRDYEKKEIISLSGCIQHTRPCPVEWSGRSTPERVASCIATPVICTPCMRTRVRIVWRQQVQLNIAYATGILVSFLFRSFSSSMRLFKTNVTKKRRKNVSSVVPSFVREKSTTFLDYLSPDRVYVQLLCRVRSKLMQPPCLQPVRDDEFHNKSTPPPPCFLVIPWIETNILEKPKNSSCTCTILPLHRSNGRSLYCSSREFIRAIDIQYLRCSFFLIFTGNTFREFF